MACERAGGLDTCVTIASQTETVSLENKGCLSTLPWMIWILSPNRQVLAGQLRMGFQPQYLTNTK